MGELIYSKNSVHRQFRQLQNENGIDSRKNNTVDTGKKVAAKLVQNGSLRQTARNSQITLSQQELTTILQQAEKALKNENEQARVMNSHSQPMLAVPEGLASVETKGEKSLTSDAKCIELMASISKLVSNSSIDKTLSNLQTWLLNNSAMQKQYAQITADLENASQAWATAKDDLSKAEQNLDVLKEDVAAAQKQVDDLDEKLAGLEKQKSNTPADSPAYADLEKQIKQTQSDLDGATDSLTTAKASYDSYLNGDYAVAVSGESTARQNVDQQMEKANQLMDSTSTRQLDQADAVNKEQNSSAYSLSLLLAVVGKLINKSAIDSQQASAELNKKLSQAAAKDAEKQAKDYAEKEAKAEQMQKTMGCVGKILGWAITIVSVVAAVFTGGASLALAAVGLALTMADEIDQAITGNSFLQKAMQPVMDALVKPLMNIFSQVFEKILEGCGVAHDTAAMVGQILGAVLAAVAMIAAVAVAGSIAAKIFSSASSEVASTVAKEVAKDVAEEVTEVTVEATEREVVNEVVETSFKDMIKNLSNSMEKMSLKLREKVAMSFDGEEADVVAMGAKMDKVAAAGRMTNSALTAGSEIYVAHLNELAAKDNAAILRDEATQELLQQMLDTAVKTFSSKMSAVNAILKNMVSASDQKMQTASYISHQIAIKTI